MDDVLAISCFTILLGITFHTSDNTEEGTSMLMLLLHAPLEIVVAVVFGLVWGLIITYLPAKPDPSPILRSQSKSSCQNMLGFIQTSDSMFCMFKNQWLMLILKNFV